MLSLLLLALALPPVPAARMAARAFGVDEQALVDIASRESYGTRMGVHSRDAWTSEPACRKAVRTGWLHDGADCTQPGWGTRGAFGLLAAYNLRYLGLDRWPWVLDIPLVSAVATVRRYSDLCPGDSWCGGEA
jgi:hypothetical protein